jgi:hypothetical protein
MSTGNRRHKRHVVGIVSIGRIQVGAIVLSLGAALVAGGCDRSTRARSAERSSVHFCAGGKTDPPPLALAYEVVGRRGNEWQEPVGPDGVSLQVRITQRSNTVASQVNFDIAPVSAVYPGGSIRRISVGEHWEPGVHDVELRWDGHDESGRRVAPGSYRLYGAARTSLDREVTCADGSGRGVERMHASEAAGLGVLVVT